MERIISLIPSYNYNPIYTDQVVVELNKVSKTILFTTHNVDTPASTTVVCDPTLGKDLVYETRKWVFNNINEDWDYVIYNEDDIFLPVESIRNVLSLYKQLPDDLLPGFIRYEFDETNNKRYIDMHPAHSVHRGGFQSIKRVFDSYGTWEPWNLHTGNWLLSKQDILHLIANNRFETYYNQHNMQYGNSDQLESSAT